MSFNIIRSAACRVLTGTATRTILSKNAVPKLATRSLWSMSLTVTENSKLKYHRHINSSHVAKHRQFCPTGCTCGLHTTGDQELVSFLKEEIELERKGETSPGKLQKIRGFDVTANGAELTFTSKDNDETVLVKLNVNHSMEDEMEEENTEMQNPEQAIQEGANMECKPPFVVEIVKGDQVLSIQCTFPPAESEALEGEDGEKYDDVIEIQEVSMYEGDFNDEVYAVSGAIIDGTLYDMILNMMEERGITADFIEELITFSTSYEHKKYISFLEQLQAFAGTK